jgi:antirestriction protein ArdC
MKSCINKQTALDVIVDQIITQMEKGTVPWKKCWKNAPRNISNHDYRGINRLILGMLPYSSPYYLTYLQAKNLGGSIRKGEHGCPIVFWKCLKYSNISTGDDGEIEVSEKHIPFMKYYRVFNIEQCENIDLSKFSIKQDNSNIVTAEELIANWSDCPTIHHRGSQPCYVPLKDYIEIPDIKYFNTSDDYYRTLYHEAIHSTGHHSRCNRKEVTGLAHFGGSDYSLEELVAEIGSCFLASHTNINPDIKNSSAYVANWLSALKNDKKMIITAAGRAEKAFNYILKSNEQKGNTATNN